MTFLRSTLWSCTNEKGTSEIRQVHSVVAVTVNVSIPITVTALKILLEVKNKISIRGTISYNTSSVTNYPIEKVALDPHVENLNSSWTKY